MNKVVALAVAGLAIATSIFVFTRPTGDMPTYSLTLAVSETPLSAPLLIADEMGMFQEEHLSVTIDMCNGGNQCFQMMADGQADLATCSTSVAMFRAFTPDQFQIFGSFATSGNDIKLIARKQKSLTSLGQLRQFRAGVVKGSASEYFFDSLMILGGDSAAPIQKHYYPPEQLAQALSDNQVDVVSIWEPWSYLLLKSQPDAELLDTKGLYQLSFNLAGKPITSQTQLDKLVALFKALEKANVFISEHPARAKAILSARLGVQTDQIDWGWDDYHFQISMGNQLLSSLEDQAQWAVQSGVIEARLPPDFRTLIDPRPLNLLRNSE
ncbi:ABC transporter substrate-binding protein [Shewanella sp. GXUN23E]|uniref:ABC transporter substrate-binding protein n=1 Tax=Shewanella sp. GXUN23E TaxID=3422498 RepID=UPI003D7C51A6